MNEVSGTDFGAVAREYHRGRPGYPARSASWLCGSAEMIADVGAGTGKLTQSLVAAGRRVVAIDPDKRMLASLSARLPAVETRPGAGECLPLEDSSVDLLTYGQSWHWVDPVRACAEAARVLRPEGVLGLIWNIRDESVDWVAELTEIITPSTAEVYVANLLAEPTGPLSEDFDIPLHHREDWVRTLTVDELVDLVASRSHTIAAAATEREIMLARVRALGESVRDADGRVELPYVTHAFRATPATGAVNLH